MINAEELRDILKEVYGVEDKYLVPMNSGWFVPTIDPEEKVGTFIGYRIISKRGYARAFIKRDAYVKPIKVVFRLSFVGPQAEELSDQTLIWDDRDDVRDAFESRGIQINYDERTAFSYPIKAQGFNDRLAWVVDLSCQSDYETPVQYGEWFAREV